MPACNCSTCKSYDNTNCASFATAAIACTVLCSLTPAWPILSICLLTAADGDAVWLALGAWAYEQNMLLTFLSGIILGGAFTQLLRVVLGKVHLLHVKIFHLPSWL